MQPHIWLIIIIIVIIREAAAIRMQQLAVE